MAIFKLGAIITEIAGSIGGSTFRRTKTNPIIMNKVQRINRSKLRQNAQLNYISQLFKKWSILPDEFKITWYTAAGLFQFPDKFGVLRYLTPRQLFTKLNGQLIPVGLYNDDASGITSDIPVISIIACNFNISLPEFNIFLSADSYPCNFTISAEIKQGVLNAPTFTRREIIYYDELASESYQDITAQFLAKFPYFNYSYNARIYVTAINNFGFKSVPVYIAASIS